MFYQQDRSDGAREDEGEEAVLARHPTVRSSVGGEMRRDSIGERRRGGIDEHGERDRPALGQTKIFGTVGEFASRYVTGATLYVDGGMTLYPGFATGG